MPIGRIAGKVAAVAAIAGVLTGSSAAFADAGEDLTSRYAGYAGNTVSYTYSWQSYGNKNVAVQDGESDGHAVYSEYDRVNEHGLRLDNDNGKGSTVYSGSSYINYVQKVTACVNVAGMPDECGPDDRPGDGR